MRNSWVFVAILIFGINGCKREQRLGGPWLIVTQETLPEAGSRQPYLYHLNSGERIYVDGLVHSYRLFDAGECICYHTTRGWWYAACRGKQPIKLSAPDVRGIGPDGWQLKSCGLVTVEPASNARPTERFIFRPEAFMRAARQQPPLRRDWSQDEGAVKAIAPEMIDVAEVCVE